jgi:ATP-dependent HslUV protease ATP-binding subunit HslU
MERMLEDVSYNAAKLDDAVIVIDAAYVDTRLAGIAGDDNVARYIL